jgi:anti-anti-sigma factor
MPLRIELTETKPGYHEMILAGQLDTETYEELDAQIDQLLQQELKAVRVDMSGLDYLSSMGLRVLLRLLKVLREHGALFLVAEVQPQILKVLEIAAALPSESIFASVEEADRYFDAIQKQVLEGD